MLKELDNLWLVCQAPATNMHTFQQTNKQKPSRGITNKGVEEIMNLFNYWNSSTLEELPRSVRFMAKTGQKSIHAPHVSTLGIDSHIHSLATFSSRLPRGSLRSEALNQVTSPSEQRGKRFKSRIDTRWHVGHEPWTCQKPSWPWISP